MREIHYEETSKVINEAKASKKYNVCLGISYTGIVLAVLWVIIFFYTCDFSKMHPSIIYVFIFEIMFWVLPFVLFIAMFIVFRKIGKKSFTEYDYSFLSGEVRVAKIPKNSNRYGVIRFQTSNIDRIGKVGSKTYENIAQMPGIKKIKLTVNEKSSVESDFYYMLIRLEGEKKLLIFDCSEVFISNVLKFCNSRAILEKDYK